MRIANRFVVRALLAAASLVATFVVATLSPAAAQEKTKNWGHAWRTPNEVEMAKKAKSAFEESLAPSEDGRDWRGLALPGLTDDLFIVRVDQATFDDGGKVKTLPMMQAGVVRRRQVAPPIAQPPSDDPAGKCMMCHPPDPPGKSKGKDSGEKSGAGGGDERSGAGATKERSGAGDTDERSGAGGGSKQPPADTGKKDGSGNGGSRARKPGDLGKGPNPFHPGDSIAWDPKTGVDLRQWEWVVPPTPLFKPTALANLIAGDEKRDVALAYTFAYRKDGRPVDDPPDPKYPVLLGFDLKRDNGKK